MDSVSVIICTRDRAPSLAETLASLGRCVVPPGLRAELLVIDNGSSDATPAVVAAAKLPGLPPRYLREDRKGLSHARNTAIAQATGDILLFTDDDVRPPVGWIEGMCRPILTGGADATAGGVHFPPEYESTLGKEPFRSRRSWLASTEGMDPRTPGNLVGANMAVRRSVAVDLGGFDLQLGAGALGFYEESLFAGRLVDAGYRIAGALDVSVEHRFDLARMTRATLLSMADRMGRSEAYVDYHWLSADAQVARAKMWRARVLFALEHIKTPWRAWTGQATWQETQRIHTLAYWRELYSMLGQPRKYTRPASANA